MTNLRHSADLVSVAAEQAVVSEARETMLVRPGLKLEGPRVNKGHSMDQPGQTSNPRAPRSAAAISLSRRNLTRARPERLT